MLRGFTFRSRANRVQQYNKTSRRGTLPLKAAIRSCVEQLESRTLLSSYVIQISVDGLRPDAITTLGATNAPNFYRLRNEGAFTDNARADYDYTETLPNHTTQLTARPVVGDNGHSVSINYDPNQTIHELKGSYVPSVYDVAHDNGLRTGLYASKDKFAFFDRSWDGTNGAPDATGVDDGRDKIDNYFFSSVSQTLTNQFSNDMTTAPLHYSLLHWSDPDVVGHASGWMSTAYLNAVKAMDGLLGQVLSLVTTSSALAGKTNIVLTADHGGVGTGHGDKTLPAVYTIPLYVWGPDVSAGADLYQLNPTSRTNPGTARLDNTVVPQPIRHGDAVNLALDFLGQGAIPTSLFNVQQDLSVRGAPLASLITPQDGGANDMDPAPGSVKVNNAQPAFSVKLSAAGRGVNDASVTASTVRMTKDGVSFTGYTFGYDGATDTIALTPTSGLLGTGLYEIHLSSDSDKISDLDGFVMAAMTLRINIDPSVVVEQTVSFQQGVSGYAGTVDTQLSESAPDTSNATAVSLSVDNDDPSGSTKDTQVLLRFDGIFGASAGQVPIGATISSATLELQITNVGSSINLHRMLRSWSATDTWSTFGGVQADGVEALATADVGTGAIGATGKRSIDVTASLAAWLANPAGNLGWVLLPTGTDGVDFYSSEGTTRPKLVVQYVPGSTPTANNDAYSVAEDDTLNVAAPGVLANDNDPELDALTAVLVQGPANGGVTLNANGSFSYTPTPDFAGIDSFTYRAFDGISYSSPATVTITVNPVNDAPVAADDNYATNEDLALVVAAPGILANDTDADGNVLSAVLVAGPAHGMLTLNANGSFSYTPVADFSGDVSFSYKVNDGTVDSNTVTVLLAIGAVNDAPVAGHEEFDTDEDTELTVDAPGLLGNDVDAEGNALSALLVSGPANGSLTLNANGSFVYTPNPNFNGTDSFTYQAGDGSALSNMATVTLSVTAVNDAPVAADDSYSVDENGTLSIAAPGVLANDSEPDGQTLSVTIAAGPSHGTVNLSTNGSFIYTPAAGYDGADSFTYTANDGVLFSNVATVTIDVKRTNVAPVAADDPFTTLEDTPLSISASDMLANDVDADGDPLTVSIVGGPAHGTLTSNADDTFTYAPNPDFNGADSFTYQAIDIIGASSNVATVTITVDPVNDAPVAVNDGFSGDEDTPISGNVLANDSDVDGNVLTAAVVIGPMNGTLTWNPDRTFTYTPDTNFNGTDSFTYQASDGLALSNVATVTLIVPAVNDAPVAVNDSFGGDEDTTISGDVLANDSDVDGNVLAATVVIGPMNGTLTWNPDRTFTYTPNANFYGTDSFAYQAGDGLALSNVATVTLSVTAVNDAPVAVDDSASVLEGGTLNGVSVLGNDIDADGDGLTAELATPPAQGTLAFNPSGTYTYTPAAGFTGTDSFTYQASDGNGGVDTATVTLTVSPLGTDDIAITESTTFGTASGLSGVSSSDDIHETIVEQVYGGKKYRLSHMWEFNVTGGSEVTFYLEAYHNSAVEDFTFSYSLDRTVWTNMLTVIKTADDNKYETFNLPASTAGRVWVQVVDTNGSDNSRDTIYVDHMFIRSLSTTALPAVSIVATDADASEAGGNAGEFTVTRTGDTIAPLVVDYSIDGTAINGADYSTLTGRIEIPAGSLSATFSVNPIDDDIDEGDQTVIISLLSSSVYAVAGSSATVTIMDDDVVLTAPSAPSDLAAVAASATQVNLTWADNSANEDGFRIERSIDGTNFSSLANVGANATSYSDLTVSASTAYQYRVQAYNTTGSSAYSDIATATTPAGDDTEAPMAPTGLKVDGTTTDSVSLSWSASTDNVGVTGYEIWRDGVSVGSTTGTSYTDTGLAASTTYSYIVRAYDAANNFSPDSTVEATTQAAASGPAAPENLVGAVTQKTKVKLTWLDASLDETSFNVYISSDGVNWGPYATVAARNNSGGTAQYTTGSLASGTWYFRVSAVNDSGESFSNVVNVTV